MFHGRHMRGLAREKEKAQDVRKTLLRLLGYFKPYSGLLVFVCILIVFGSLIEVVSPYLIGVAVDQFIDPKGVERPAWLAGFLPLAAAGQQSQHAAGLAIPVLAHRPDSAQCCLLLLAAAYSEELEMGKVEA